MKRDLNKHGRKNVKTPVRRSRDLYEVLESFFGKYQKQLFVLSMILSGLMCVLLFDVKVSLSGDDCDYVI
jgi:hypothetical protein